jgi:hypothetical protein
MPQPLIVDSRLPETDIPANDPANPRNLIRSAQMASAQSAADTRYDPTPPARVEGFENQHEILLYALGAFAIIAISVIYARRAGRHTSMIIKGALAIAAILTIQRILSRLH